MKQPRMRTAGAKALRRYLNKIKTSVPVFCEANDLDRITVQRVLNGERTRISVDFAYAIYRATGGAVSWHLFRSATARPVEADAA